jgi:hypothetical protein
MLPLQRKKPADFCPPRQLNSPIGSGSRLTFILLTPDASSRDCTQEEQASRPNAPASPARPAIRDILTGSNLGTSQPQLLIY